MDPIICCLLGPCCPPFTVEQLDKLAGLLAARYQMQVAPARQMASDMIEAVRPLVGLLRPIIDEARKHPKD